MTTTLIEGILATVFTLSGTIIYVFKDQLKHKLSWLNNFSPSMVQFICFSKILGALGLLLPIQFGFYPILTPLAALGIATIMILAIVYHLQKKEYKDLPATLIFLALSVVAAYQRFILF